jgi:hypothetical protein
MASHDGCGCDPSPRRSLTEDPHRPGPAGDCDSSTHAGSGCQGGQSKRDGDGRHEYVHEIKGNRPEGGAHVGLEHPRGWTDAGIAEGRRMAGLRFLGVYLTLHSLKLALLSHPADLPTRTSHHDLVGAHHCGRRDAFGDAGGAGNGPVGGVGLQRVRGPLCPTL